MVINKTEFELQLDLDESKDASIIQELLGKSKDYRDFARRMTDYFSKKYGAEFKGNVLFEYEPTGNDVIMTCLGQERIFDAEDELPEIAMHLKFLRKAVSRQKAS